MSWELKPVPAPLIDGVEELASSISAITQPVIDLLDAASSALGAVEAFAPLSTNPTTALALALIDEVQNLSNDIFGTGVFQLVVQPFEVPNKFGVPLIGQSGPIDTKIKLQQTLALPNDLGIPSLNPGRVIDKIIQSLDDEGDADRPQFSANAEVTAFGFMITAPDPDGFASLLDSLLAVWGDGRLQKLLDRLLEITNVNTAGATPIPSRKPDWDSLRLNSVTPLKQTQDQLNNMIAMLRGLVGSGDELVSDFLRLIERKINNLQIILQDFNELINLIKNATAASGIYVLNVPPGIGGNERLKTEIDSQIFDDQKDHLAAAIIYVGGGPSLAAVDSIRSLLE